MTFLLTIHCVLSLVFAAAIGFLYSRFAGLSFLAGTGFSLLNLLALVAVWPLILRKKLFALSIGIIVIKFAILGSILYEVVQRKPVDLLWFALGFSVVIMSVVATSLYMQNTPELSEIEG